MTRLTRTLPTPAPTPARGAVLQPASSDVAPLPSSADRPGESSRGGIARTVAAVFAFLFAATLVLAQSVSWDPPAGSLARSQTSELSLVFQDCSPNDDFALPRIAGLQIGRPSQSTQTSIINMKMSKRVVFTYPVVPTAASGRIVIPEFDVATDKGRLRVAAAAYEVGEATVGRTNVPIEQVASATLSAQPTTVWAGEVFALDYQLLVSRRFNPTNVGERDWTPPDTLYVEPWTKMEVVNAVVGGDNRVGVANRTRAAFKEAGDFQLPVPRQTVDLAAGGRSFDFFGRQPNVEQFLINGTTPSIHVKPLPRPAPADFLGAVGDFTFTSKVVPTTAAVGEPVTWTLTLEGTGNWPEGLALPSREVSRDFRAFQPNVQRKIKDGTLFDGTLTEDVVLMPTKPGTYTLGPVSYAFFESKTGKYKTVRTEPVKVTITAAPPADPTSGAAGPGTAPVFQFTPDATPGPEASAVVKSPAPTLPGHLPMMPLDPARSTTSTRPWARISPLALLAPLPALALLALALGARRARLTDPRRQQRAALAALPGALEAVRAATGDEARLPALRNWQQLAALAWGTGHAAPSADSFEAALQTEIAHAKPDEIAAWRRLWSEAEACLYGPRQPLPADWAERAATAQRRARLRRRPLFAFLRPSNLWPLPLIALLALGTPRAPAAGAADEAYRKAEFALAEKAWRASLEVTPDNWVLHHNLGLALAQQDRWSEAAAHWSVAFLAAPRDPAVRWHLALGLERSEFTQPEMAALASGRGLARLARQASPAEWQRLVVAGSALVGLALAAGLLGRHFPRRRLLPWSAGLLALAGVLALAGGSAALREYGELAHPDAVLLWQAAELRSVPTEAGEQKTEPLAAGTIARRTKSFFGWDELFFPNGQTGWIRREHLLPLYPVRRSD